MGGINSGRRRTIHIGAVEHYPSIDLRILKRAGLLRGGECTYDTLSWRNQAPNAFQARILIDLSDTSYASIRIHNVDENIGGIQRIGIVSAPCGLGGVRYYFVCPIGGNRCEILYLVDGKFASRKGHKLTFGSQSEGALTRARRRVRKATHATPAREDLIGTQR
jgi:hypothetical protein